MKEQENEVDAIGELIGGVIAWCAIALILFAARHEPWGFFALGAWVTLIVADILQSQIRDKKMLIRILWIL